MTGAPPNTPDVGWNPSEALLLDVRHTLAHAPRETPQDRFEAWAWRAMLDEDGPALLTRHARPAHVTASAIVLSPDARRTLLVLHSRIGLWVHPGGHLEEGDRCLADAAAREVLEETGLGGRSLPEIACLSRHHAPCRPDVDWHLDVVSVIITPVTEPTVSPESDDVRWWEVDDLPRDRVADLDDTLRRALATMSRAPV